MYGQNHFSQNPSYDDVPRYLSHYPPPQMGNWYYPVSDSWILEGPGGNNEDPTTIALRKRKENCEFIENFVGECEESYGANEKHAEVKIQTLKISEVRNLFINAFGMIRNLESVCKELKDRDDLSDEEWAKKRQECAVVEEKLTELLDKIESVPDVVASLKRKLDQRRKKRRREAKKRTERRVDKTLAVEKRARRHVEIDAWIREKRDVIEREKQAELLRKDADIVLSDVRGKRNDARKFLGLLQELQNLRRVKVTIARARGENLPPAADQAFDNIIGQLVEQWSCLDREYAIEEQGLKLMLKTDNEQKIEKRTISTFDDWERALFGRKLRSPTAKVEDLHTFVMMRHAWDKYANFEGQGSRIPIGWIIPVPPSSAAWQKCLRRVTA